MTKEVEKEIDNLYEFLGIGQKDEEEKNSIRRVEWKDERTVDLFAKRWDSSFFANSTRY